MWRTVRIDLLPAQDLLVAKPGEGAAGDLSHESLRTFGVPVRPSFR